MKNFEDFQDPLCYEGTNILINKPGIVDYQKLQEFERMKTCIRQSQLALNPIKGNFNLAHFQEIHGYLFQDIYEWAGQTRNCELSKSDTNFCYPHYINSAANEIFNQLKKDNYYINLGLNEFAEKMGALWGDINHLHPFREGNGRATREFLREVALNANYKLNLEGINPDYMIEASKESIVGYNQKLIEIVKERITPLEINLNNKALNHENLNLMKDPYDLKLVTETFKKNDYGLDR